MFPNSCCLPASKGRQLYIVTLLVSILMIIQIPVISAAPAIQPTPSSIKNQAKDQGRTGIAVEVGYGYRRDSFDWNIAGDLQGDNPNVLSELKWKDLLIHEVHLGLRTNLKKSFVLKGSISYG